VRYRRADGEFAETTLDRVADLASVLGAAGQLRATAGQQAIEGK
jgi:hypothetical protein